MKKLHLIILAITLISRASVAQVAINSDGSLPDNSAMLDVKSTNKGILIPRMTQAQRNAITTPANGLMIYQTDNSPGFYYNSGTSGSPAWLIAGTGSGWGLAGNSGTSEVNNFIGTTNYVSLNFRVNNQPAGKIDILNYNISLGHHSLEVNTIGSRNSAYGFSSLSANTNGNNNTAIGAWALSSNSTGFFNTATGAQALAANITGNANTAIGAYSMYYNTTGSSNTATGASALQFNLTGFNNTAYGFSSLMFNTEGALNAAFGSNALYVNTIGSYNVANGCNALSSNTTGNLNTGNGYFSLYSNTDGYQNTACGAQALQSNTSGINNCAVGYVALLSNTVGIDNTATGVASLYYNISGSANTADGREALRDNISSNNTAVGYHASQTTSTGFQNTSIGSYSLINNTTGSYNTALGYNTGPNSSGLANTTCVGTDARATATDMVRLGNVFVNSIGGQVSWTTLSDGRFKENVKEDVPGLAFITQLRPVTYRINRESVNDFTGLNAMKQEQSKENTSIDADYGTEPLSPTTTGFIAQEVETAAKNIGFEFSGVDGPDNENDMYGLRYAEFVVPLVKAVQELAEQNEQLKAENAKLEERLMAIENKLAEK